jgi:hypothetical protein
MTYTLLCTFGEDYGLNCTFDAENGNITNITGEAQGAESSEFRPISDFLDEDEAVALIKSMSSVWSVPDAPYIKDINEPTTRWCNSNGYEPKQFKAVLAGLIGQEVERVGNDWQLLNKTSQAAKRWAAFSPDETPFNIAYFLIKVSNSPEKEGYVNSRHRGTN